MNQQPSPLWTHLTSQSRLTGTWRSALPDYRNLPSPCLGACPVDGRIAQWVRQVENRDFHGAWLTLVDNNPFPAIAGRICHHPCETACNRQYLDETVGICDLERFVGDMALAEGWGFGAPQVERDKSVAIVGGGPAGLSAAWQLRRAGYRVTLIEAQGELGGLMRHGIPAYRLDRAVLDGEIARITDMGITVELNAAIGGADELRELRARHDAVFLATGASRAKPLPGLDHDQPWVIDSAAFLAATNGGQPCDAGARVVVIGGGSAAMDVARTARRLGRAVTVLALESDARLPAQAAEVAQAREEGVEFVTGAMMQSVRPGGDGLTLTCIRVDFRPGAVRGEFSVDPVAGSEFTLTGDTIIPSIGQDADLARWDGLLEGNGPVLRATPDWRGTAEGIFVGGDVASMDRFVTAAIGMGKQAAAAIIRHIDPLNAPEIQPDAPETGFDRINTAYHPPASRRRAEDAPLAARLGDFREVQQPLDADAALAEAGRCFSCGTCTFCDNCYFYCPDMAIIRHGDSYEVNADYCKGCGLCVAECPTGAIRMYEETQP